MEAFIAFGGYKKQSGETRYKNNIRTANNIKGAWKGESTLRTTVKNNIQNKIQVFLDTFVKRVWMSSCKSYMITVNGWMKWTGGYHNWVEFSEFYVCFYICFYENKVWFDLILIFDLVMVPPIS